MTWPIGIAIYLTTWWIVLFAILPFGVRSQHETESVTPGTDPGAPVLPRLGWKVLATTLVSAAVFGGIWWLMAIYGD